MTITLLSCVRDGLATQVPAGVAPDAAGRARFQAAVSVAGQESTPVDVRLFGPGDVTGIDPRQVIRMDPPAGVQGTEPNYFCLVEFDRPDLPWLFSPGAPDAQGRLQPWIALVVVPVRDGITLEHPAGAPLPVLKVDDVAELPDLDDAWAWAHVQIAGTATTAAAVTAAVRGSPELTLSRLLCPRLLDPHAPYRACVVPTFEAGQHAGLGQAPTGGAARAWAAGAPAPPLPVYHSWEFVTGDPGDFETLARRITAIDAPEGVGTRTLDISVPGAAKLDNPGATLVFSGPLRPSGRRTLPWGDAAREAALADLVDGATGTVVGPPLYGGRPAGKAAVPHGAAPRPAWLREVNLDPRHRGAAALGARIVQINQEDLMRAAWEQAGAIEEANRRLRAARMARRAGRSFVQGRLAGLAPPVLLGLTGPALDRLPVRTDGTLARSRLGQTRMPPGVLQPAFRRLMRPGGRLGRMLGGPERLGGVTEALDAGRARPDRSATGRPGGLVTVGGLIAAARAARRSVIDGGGRAPVGLDAAGAIAPHIGARRPTIDATRTPGRATVGLRLTDRDRVVGGGSLVIGELRPARMAPLELMAQAVEDPSALGELDGAVGLTLAGQVYVLTDEVRDGLGMVLSEPAQPPSPPDPGAALAAVREELLNALDPDVTVLKAVRVSVRVPDELQGDDPLDEVLAVPIFPAPLAPELAELSGDLLLPGADRTPDDSAFGLVTNAAYVQALLIGANHEMARELRWRGFPTDERGTCFKFFWDARGTTLDPAGPSPDIRAIHEFAPAGALGDEVGGGRGQVVLVVRAQLLRRYPGTQVLAVRGEPDGAGGRRPRYDAQAVPRFRGRIGQDIVYFGFGFDDAQARGGGAAGPATTPSSSSRRGRRASAWTKATRPSSPACGRRALRA